MKIHGFCSSFKVKWKFNLNFFWKRILKMALKEGLKGAPLEGFLFEDGLKKLFIQKAC